MDERSTTLLKTKLYIPPARPNLVLRPRLDLKLGQALEECCPLILVSAKAGSGKTTLVSQWIHQQGHPAVWLSLDANDNDPRRFCAYLLTAMQQLDSTIGRSILSRLEAPQLPQAEALIVEFVNEVANLTKPFILVLDDYHLIQEAWIHQALGFLVEHQPPTMQIILITRADPPLPLARLRGRGHMAEVRDRDLRFNGQEAERFLNGVMALDLSSEAVSTLEDRTEGWIVGLQLAAISLRGRRRDGDKVGFIERFGGANRFVLDYLLEEILNQQAPAVQDFLIETCILGRMCGSLCDAVRFGITEIDDGSIKLGAQHDRAAANGSQSILEELEQKNLFLLSLDSERRWYRYHHLFADLLKSTLQQRKSVDEIRQLHRHAAGWHRDHGSLEEAMTHTMAAQDYEQAASMVNEYFFSMFSSSEVPVLLGWFEKLPEQVVRGRPWVDVYRAYTLALSSRVVEVESLLEDVESRITPNTPRASELLGHIAAIHSFTANLRGDPARVFEMAALVQRRLGEKHQAAQGMAAYALADTYFANDQIDHTEQALISMLAAGEKEGRLLVIIPALCELAAIKQVRGQLLQAQELYDQAYKWLLERNGMDSRERCYYEFGLADLLREWNQLDTAYEHVMTGDELRRRLGGFLVVGDLALMRVLQAMGDVNGALEALRNAEQAMETYPFQLSARIEFATARIIQWLAVGDVATAERWASACSGGSELEQIALARLRLAQGRLVEAEELLHEQRLRAEAGGRMGRLIHILALQAMALKAQSYINQAEGALSQAIYLARPQGYQRLFLDLGQPIYELLERKIAQGTAAKSHDVESNTSSRGYESELIEAFQGEQHLQTVYAPPTLTGGMVDPLTDREQDVLRLLAEGITNKEIASRMVVAPSTVKQHLKNIYSKLAVHNRTQAVARGRELELL